MKPADFKINIKTNADRTEVSVTVSHKSKELSIGDLIQALCLKHNELKKCNEKKNEYKERLTRVKEVFINGSPS